MGLLGGDKNSPKTQQTSSSTTKNTQIGGPVSAGANSTVGGSVVLSDLTGVDHLNISTTDQGAVNAGLSVALKSLDTASSENKSLISATTSLNQSFLDAVSGASTRNTDVAQSALQSAIGIASDVSNGQQNTSLRYILYGIVALGAVAAAYAYFSSKRRG
jgi:hypothetical protein